jgi:hypothetical protein
MPSFKRPDRKPLGNMAITDPYPGITGILDDNADIQENPLYSIDPDKPASPAPDPSITDLLQAIRDNTAQAPGQDLFFTAVQFIPGATASDGEVSVYAPESFRHLYVAKVPRGLNVYAGAGKSLFLAAVPTGKSLRAEMPYTIDAITLEWIAATAPDQYVSIVFSNRKFDVQVI